VSLVGLQAGNSGGAESTAAAGGTFSALLVEVLAKRRFPEPLWSELSEACCDTCSSPIPFATSSAVLVSLYSSIRVVFGSAQQERNEIPSVLCTMSSVLRARQEAWCNPQAASNVGEAPAHLSGGGKSNDTEDGASRPLDCRTAVAPH
jgi:hypothetical protein